MPLPRLVVLLLALLLVALPRSPGAQPPTPPALPADEAHFRELLPASPAGSALAWFLSVLSGAQPLGEFRDRFADTFFDRLTPQQFAAAVDNYRTQAFAHGLAVLRVKPGATDSALVAVVRGRAPSGTLDLDAILTLDDQGKINLLWLLVSRPDKIDIPSWEELDYQLAVYPGRLGFAAARLTDDGFSLLHVLNPATPLAVASTFKLYIAALLCEQIIDGTLEWDQRLPIREDLKSLPPGLLRTSEPGAEFSLLDFAVHMIAASDNTATDHLIHFLGRDRVEACFVRHNPNHALSLPLLTTREVFTLKLTPPLAQRYLAADAPARRAMLAEIALAPLPADQARGWLSPKYIDSIEYFASPLDCCELLAHFAQLTRHPRAAPLAEALARHNPVPLDPAVWKSCLTKGGSEVGVYSRSIFLERADGARFLLSLSWNFTLSEVIGHEADALLLGVIDFLAAQP